MTVSQDSPTRGRETELLVLLRRLIPLEDTAFRSTSECGEWRTEPRTVARQEGIHPGTWLVGTQVLPGTYRANARRLCYWARLAGFGANQEDIVEDGLVEAAAGAELTVTIEDSDAGFYTDDDCGPWTRVEDPP